MEQLYDKEFFSTFQRHFDAINHNILFQKLVYYGFFESSKKRKQFVSLHGIESQYNTVKIGVPKNQTT